MRSSQDCEPEAFRRKHKKKKSPLTNQRAFPRVKTLKISELNKNEFLRLFLEVNAQADSAVNDVILELDVIESKEACNVGLKRYVAAEGDWQRSLNVNMVELVTGVSSNHCRMRYRWRLQDRVRERRSLFRFQL